MIEVVKELIKRQKLLNGVHKVILGYSGGPDSTFLREVLSGEKEEIMLAYFNHNLRNDSVKEEKFVKKEAKRLNLGLRVEGKDVRNWGKSFTEEV